MFREGACQLPALPTDQTAVECTAAREGSSRYNVAKGAGELCVRSARTGLYTWIDYSSPLKVRRCGGGAAIAMRGARPWRPAL